MLRQRPLQAVLAAIITTAAAPIAAVLPVRHHEARFRFSMILSFDTR